MYDILIKNGNLIDGSGAEEFCADVAVTNGKIVTIGTNLGVASQVIDATGLVVTPGFIDSHSHSDAAIFSFPGQIEKVEQGITTSIGGQCGLSPAPVVKDGKLVKMSDFYKKAYETPQGSNISLFAGHCSLRSAVMGMDVRKPTPEELEQMKDLLRDGMDNGALGVSFGLIYPPSCYAQTDELIALAKVAAEKGGMIAAHIRNESDQLEEAVEEFISIVKAAGCRGVISHHKAAYRQNHGKVKKTLAMVEQANREGCEIYCDVYPYTASKTALSARFIPKAYINGNLPETLKDPAKRQSFKEAALAELGEDLSWVLLCDCHAYPQYSGLRLNEAAKLHGKDGFETAFDILEKEPRAQGCYFTMCEEDVETVIAWKRSMICTDSGIAGNFRFYHPRLRGSFPRALGRYVRERKTVSLPELIRKMTALPAKVYSLQNKGLLKEGFDADICIFDPETISDKATYTEVSHRAEGLRWVIVGGQVAAEDAIYTGTLTGKVLSRH